MIRLNQKKKNLSDTITVDVNNLWNHRNFWKISTKFEKPPQNQLK